MTTLTLLRQASQLAEPTYQVEILKNHCAQSLPDFDETLGMHGLPFLQACSIEVLQINVGKVCNQTCEHCHVDAGPDRREAMTRETAEACLRVLAESDIPTLDITGGAPEMNPQFRWMVGEARRLGRRVIDRCNLTILIRSIGRDDSSTATSTRCSTWASTAAWRRTFTRSTGMLSSGSRGGGSLPAGTASDAPPGRDRAARDP
jgi:hypothetical protein